MRECNLAKLGDDKSAVKAAAVRLNVMEVSDHVLVREILQQSELGVDLLGLFLVVGFEDLDRPP